jgi:hypothetical protein
MESKSDLTVTQQKLLNGVNYESLPETTISVSRSFKKQFFQKDTYTQSNNEAICDFNTGAEFVNPRRSYLTFKCKVKFSTYTGALPADKFANFGRGGATNLIRRIVITSRSGVELSRTEDYNILAAKLVRWGCSREYVEQMGQLSGFTNDTALYPTTAGQFTNKTEGVTDTKTFVIPCCLLSGFFSGDGKSLIPPQLSAGLRIQLTMDSPEKAFVSTEAVTYELSDISFVTNVTTMVDSWQKQLNEESARDGLTYSYPEWHTTQSNVPASQSRVNIEVRKAVARCMMAFTVTQDSAAAAVGTDSMKSEAYDATSVEYRLGSLYPTQQPVKSGEEMYFIAQSMWDSGISDCKDLNNVSVDSFKQSTAGSADGDGITATSLERNDVAINNVLNIGGLPTNNSRVLAVDITFSQGASRTTYLYMKHLRVVKAFLDNCVVSE